MEKRRFGKTDMQVSVLGFGGAEIGFEEASPQTVAELLSGALDVGLNVIDTAECYLASEELIGQAIADRRSEYYLFTKCGHPEGLDKGANWRPKSLLTSIERSLRRLRTDCVDLMQLHTCSEAELRKGDVIEALRTARQRGYCRYIGYSGDSGAARFAVECGQFDSLMTSVSIADQEAVDLVLPLAAERQMGVIAKRPIANAAWRYDQKPENSYHQVYWERLQQLDYNFLRSDQRLSVATALRFTLTAPGVDVAIVGTKTPGRLQENAALIEAGPLSQQQFDEIRARWKEVAEPTWTGQA